MTYAVVVAYIPLAWDRYCLPIQAVSSLLAAGAVLAVADGSMRRGKTLLGRT